MSKTNELRKVKRAAIELLESIITGTVDESRFIMYRQGSGEGDSRIPRYISGQNRNRALDDLALYFLEDVGALYPHDSSSGRQLWRVSAHAEKALKQLKSPRRVWLEENYFPVGSLVVVGLVGVGTIISNFIA